MCYERRGWEKAGHCIDPWLVDDGWPGATTEPGGSRNRVCTVEAKVAWTQVSIPGGCSYEVMGGAKLGMLVAEDRGGGGVHWVCQCQSYLWHPFPATCPSPCKWPQSAPGHHHIDLHLLVLDSVLGLCHAAQGLFHVSFSCSLWISSSAIILKAISLHRCLYSTGPFQAALDFQT